MNNEQIYFQARPQKARDFRKIAWNALKGFWWTAILVTLIASLLGGVAVGGGSFNFGSSGTSYEDDYYYEDEYDPEYSDSNSIGIIGGAEDSVVLTPEETEELETAIKNFDLETVGNILSENNNPMLGFLLSFFGIIFAIVAIFALAFHLFVSSPVKVGYQRFCLEVLDGNTSEVRVGTLFRFFTESYGKTIALNFVHSLIMTLTLIPMYIGLGVGVVQFMGTLPALLASETPQAIVLPFLTLIGVTYAGMIISMIINIPVSYMYSMAHMIMADYPSVGAVEALRLSRQMMKGNKFRLFCLDFSFIGWYLLGACACGLGMYFVMPYQYVARAAFYHEISNRHGHEEVEFPSVNPEDYIIE